MQYNSQNSELVSGIDALMDNEPAEGLPVGLVLPYDTAQNAIYDQTRQLMGTIVGYKEMMMIYACAIKEIRTRFDVLDTESRVRYQRNPISSVSTRIKSAASIAEKLERKQLGFSLENIEKNIYDVAGIRVVCSYIDDIYAIAEALLAQDDIRLVTRKDYIANPKPNGYRSLHLIVNVPVFFAKGKKEVNVEVQIRTIAMDFWASLEHQLKYKQDIPSQQEIISQLKECAEISHATDEKMLNIRRQIEKESDSPTEDDVLISKMSRLDIPL